MATERSPHKDVNLQDDARFTQLATSDFQRNFLLLPKDALRAQIRKMSPDLDDATVEEVLRGADRLKLADPLAVLHENSLTGDGQMNLMKLAPNFEMSMYLAQVTGSCIVTDSPFRWAEIGKAIRRRFSGSPPFLAPLAQRIQSSAFSFPVDVSDIAQYAASEACAAYSALMRDTFKYLSHIERRGPKPNYEASIAARFTSFHAQIQAAITKSHIPVSQGRISCVFPVGGIQDNTVNRLLLMSSSELHLPSVPMAFFIEALRSG